ncbi:MAG: HAD family hydrolase [Candidatus Bathyarchaeia archaeon]
MEKEGGRVMVERKLKAKALLIDLDGTIVDSMQVFEEAAKAAFSAIGHSKSSDSAGLEIVRCLQRNLPLNGFLAKMGVDKDLTEKFLTTFLQSFYYVAPSKTRLLPDVDETLRRLSAVFLLALITRRQTLKKLVEQELKRLRIDQYFTAVVTGLEVEKPTPSPDPILRAANQLQVATRDCVVVSDSGVDIKAAKTAGAKSVAVLSGVFEKEELEQEAPDLIINDVNCLPQCLIGI